MIVTFEESGMTFKVEKDSLYRIEKSPVASSMQSMKVCECVVRTGRFLDLIEAKTSAPNPNNPDKTDLLDFYRAVERKFIDTLLFTSSITVKRNADNECPETVKDVNIANIKYRFFLVIKDLETRFLPEQLSCFKKQLKHITKAWKIDYDCLKVLNEEEARRKNLIV